MPLKQIIFFRLIKQLSEVYVSMTIEDFEHAASIVCGHTSRSCLTYTVGLYSENSLGPQAFER